MHFFHGDLGHRIETKGSFSLPLFESGLDLSHCRFSLQTSISRTTPNSVKLVVLLKALEVPPFTFM